MTIFSSVPRRLSRVAVLALGLVPAVGCGGSDGGGGGGDAGGPGGDGGGGTVDGPGGGGGYVPLITADFSIPAGEEFYFCATRTLTEDLYVGAIRPIAPEGTHHTTVSLNPGGAPDDPGSVCGVEFGQFYASGVGTEALVLPTGVGLVARAGEQVRLNLHLFNGADGVITGTSGIEVALLDVGDVEHEATLSISGPFNLDLAPTGAPIEVVHEADVGDGGTIIAIFPHMHQLGTHFTSRILRGGETFATLWDQDYQFETQEFELVGPVVALPGDSLETRCTFVNDTGTPVGWGDSSEAEMCFSIVMAY